MEDVKKLLKEKLSGENYQKLMALDNSRMHRFVADAIELCRPASVFVCSDARRDHDYIRRQAVEKGEEKALDTKGHTCHFDGFNDQARDKSQTKYLLSADSKLCGNLNWTQRESGISEVRSFLAGSMEGREMLVCFFCLGPTDSEFSIACVQITDSPYVAHSEIILYRPGYEQFGKIGDSQEFFRFLHSEGELENKTSKNIDKRRIYIDLAEEMVYSVNTQYGGNTIGLKKLALRLAIQKASRQGWLAEHMFVMGAHGPGGRVTYFTGAFPSACGKTSTSMLPGQSIVGDDIAYLRKKDGAVRAANVEKGVFGIIRDVNPHDDPVIYGALTSPCEVIFSNVLIGDGDRPYWLGMGQQLPEEGVNHSGKWHKGKKDAKGREITASHKNARYCLNIAELENADALMDDAGGVEVGGIIYGGRDSDTWVPVEQAFSWTEGIIAKGASIESESTAATLGAEGVRTFNIMSNQDFLSIAMGKYIENNLQFAEGLKKPPLIFSVNYFLKGSDGKYLNEVEDKKVWILWAELRANGDVEALKTPTGCIPLYDDLAKLFEQHLNKSYSREAYSEQFGVRIPENLAKMERVEKIYTEQVPDTPDVVFETFSVIRSRLEAAQEKYGDYITPFELEVI